MRLISLIKLALTRRFDRLLRFVVLLKYRYVFVLNRLSLMFLMALSPLLSLTCRVRSMVLLRTLRFICRSARDLTFRLRLLMKLLLLVLALLLLIRRLFVALIIILALLMRFLLMALYYLVLLVLAVAMITLFFRVIVSIWVRVRLLVRVDRLVIRRILLVSMLIALVWLLRRLSRGTKRIVWLLTAP